MASTNDSGGTMQALVRELTLVFEPVADAGKSARDGNTDRIVVLIERMGLGEAALGEQFEAVKGVVMEITEAYTSLEQSVLSGGSLSPGEIDDAIASIDDLFSALRKLDDVRPSGGDRSAPKLVVDYLLVTYLREYHGELFDVLRLCDLASTGTPGELELGAVSGLFENPNRLAAEAHDWGTADFRAFTVLFYVQQAMRSIGLPARMVPSRVDDLSRLDPTGNVPASAFELEDDVASTLQLPLLSVDDGPVPVETGVRVVPLPGSAGNDLPGLAVVPYGKLSTGTEIPLGDGWTFNVSVSAETSDFGVTVRPTTDDSLDVAARDLGDGGTEFSDLSATAEITQSQTDGSASDETVLLETADGTKLSLHSLALRSSLDYSGDDLTSTVELPATGRFEVNPKGGFLETVFPDPLGFDFDATVGWSNADGVYFEGGGTMEASVPMNLDLGVASIEELYLALALDDSDSDVAVEVATTPKLSLGPVTGSVKRVGVTTDVSFPEDRDGNLGPLDVALGFRHPDGIALAVDTGPVSGKGFLEFEPEKHRYAGGFELAFSEWGLKVVGLLKTELPGTDGFSLLLIVAADLPPVQLGFGFVLTGIGGLAGVHRGFKKKPLGKAVRAGNIDSVLFPKNVVENADQIVTDLRSIFPPKANRHVFGPMVRLGWGTPVVVQAELGLLVGVPSWKVALVGAFMIDLPDEEAALIDINLAVVGVLDIPNGELSIDASLYDSRLVQWTLSGEMAMRAAWGERSRFLLSIGGFHERFETPSGFPEVDPVTAALAVPGGNPRLELTGYFAITPNTTQVGAAVVLHGEFGPATVHGELSFDALFRYNPFQFVVDVHAGISLEIAGQKLSKRFDGTLKGPQPYDLHGKLSVSLLFVDTTVTVDATFGESGGSESIPTANILPKLADELQHPANWLAQKPQDGSHIVTLRDPDAEDDEAPPDDRVLAHPRGTLGVRQRLVPLSVDIEKYGNAKPRHDRYELTKLSVPGSDRNLAGTDDLTEQFARGRFEKLSESEKLQSEAFESEPAGKRMENGLVHYAGATAGNESLLSWATLEYEASVIDAENDRYWTESRHVAEAWETRLGLAHNDAFAEQSAVASADTRTTGGAAYENPDASGAVGLAQQRYVVVWSATLRRLDVEDNPESGRTQAEARNVKSRYVDAHDAGTDDLQVVGVQEVAGGGGDSG